MKYRIVHHPGYGYKAERQDPESLHWYNVHSGYYQAVESCKEEIDRYKEHVPKVVHEEEG